MVAIGEGMLASGRYPKLFGLRLGFVERIDHCRWYISVVVAVNE